MEIIRITVDVAHKCTNDPDKVMPANEFCELTYSLNRVQGEGPLYYTIDSQCNECGWEIEPYEYQDELGNKLKQLVEDSIPQVLTCRPMDSDEPTGLLDEPDVP